MIGIPGIWKRAVFMFWRSIKSCGEEIAVTVQFLGSTVNADKYSIVALIHISKKSMLLAVSTVGKEGNLLITESLLFAAKRLVVIAMMTKRSKTTTI